MCERQHKRLKFGFIVDLKSTWKLCLFPTSPIFCLNISELTSTLVVVRLRWLDIVYAIRNLIKSEIYKLFTLLLHLAYT